MKLGLQRKGGEAETGRHHKILVRDMPTNVSLPARAGIVPSEAQQ